MADGFIDGMEPPSIPEIDDLAKDYVKARDARMKHLKKEIDLGEELLQAMKAHDLKEYELPSGEKVEVCILEKTKVRKPKKEEE